MVVVRVENVSFSYDSRLILKDVSFSAYPGEITAIIGPNGAGKSTLLKLLANILVPKSGKILFDERDIKEMDKEEIIKMISYCPQENVIPGILTVYETVLMGRIPYLSLRVSKENLEMTENIIRKLGLEKYSKKYTNQLSGGERQIVLIAQALVREPKVLLLDEPVSNLDIRNQLEILELIKNITQHENITTILVLHDLNLAARFADKIVILNNGKVYSYGEPENILTPDTIREVYKVRAIVTKNEGFINIIPLCPI
ncbi:MAG TPA: ABC transporter ATP-binding protein [Archaeoglobus profundus]|nr:ABC transporter ATP-binding protein [Archaeoglobus profundus]HIP58433.1 ABC transporter ATP-binding protein [Archaeoglobus profundus]